MKSRITSLLLLLAAITTIQAAEITTNNDVATVTGEITKEDLPQITSISQSVIDLTDATFASNVAITDIANANVEYLALPMDMTKDQVQLKSFNSCPKLLAAASLKKQAENDYQITAFIKDGADLKEGLLAKTKIRLLLGTEYYFDTNNIKKAIVSGTIDAKNFGYLGQCVSIDLSSAILATDFSLPSAGQWVTKYIALPMNMTMDEVKASAFGNANVASLTKLAEGSYQLTSWTKNGGMLSDLLSNTTLAETLSSKGNQLDYLSKAVLAGTIVDKDLNVANHAKVIDLTDITNSNGYDFAKFANSSVEYLALPLGTSADKVNAETFAGCTSLKAVGTLEMRSADSKYKFTTYVKEAGCLDDLISNTSLSDLLKGDNKLYTATIIGSIDETDMTLASPIIDITQGKFAEGSDLSKVDNGVVECLALPMGLGKDKMQGSTFSNFKKLKAATSLSNSSDGKYRITAYIEQAGSLYNLLYNTTLMTTLGGNQDNPSFTNLNEAVISGNINACDIAISNQDNHVKSNGHYDASATNNGSKPGFGLNNATTISLLDLENAIFRDNDASEEYHDADMTLSRLGYSEKLTSLILPVSPHVTTIPANACNNLQGLTSICIPSNYEVIGEYAFNLTPKLSHIYTTPAKDDEVTKENYNHGDKTYTLPSSLKSIGTGAFNTGMEEITDLYVLAKTAPECGKDAFTSGMYQGWGGFIENGDIHHPYSRASYNNNGILFTVFHFPNDVDGENLKKYTDPTRVYTLKDETGATDGDGNPKMWPTLGEFKQSYEQAGKGVIWDGTTAYDTKYTGWHQFCLAESKYLKENGKVVDFSRFKKNDWYSYCVPYDIRKSDLLRYLGNPDETKYPDVTTLVQVMRNGDTQKVTLIFSQNLIDQDVELDDNGRVKENADGTVAYTQYTDDDPIVIHAGRPYLIHPWYKSGESPKFGSEEKYTAAIKAGTEGSTVTLDKTFDHASKEAKTVLLHDHWDVLSKTTGTNVKAMEYRFQGIYNSGYKIPDNCYFLAESKKYGINKFWWSGQSTYDIDWSPYSALIIARPANPIWNTTGNYTLTVTGEDDSFSTSNTAKHGSVTFDFTEMGNTTGISTVVDGQEVDATYGRVYNLNGQYVGTSLKGLQKGIYVVNGKKIVVK